MFFYDIILQKVMFIKNNISIKLNDYSVELISNGVEEFEKLFCVFIVSMEIVGEMLLVD